MVKAKEFLWKRKKNEKFVALVKAINHLSETHLINSDTEYQKALSQLDSQNSLFGQQYESVNISNF